MKITLKKGPRGIALIIVLIVIAILAVLAGNFAASMKVETILARNTSFDCEFEWLGRAGIEAARAVLAEGKDPYTALNQKWAGGMGDTNGAFADFDLHHFPIGDTGRFVDIEIIDQDRFFNINRADEMILGQALELIGVDPSDKSTIVDSILDWRDIDDNRNASGAESADYQSSPWLPHVAKNGPIDDMSELLLIHGITEQPQIYSRAFGQSGASVITRHNRLGRSKFEEVVYETTLTDLFTTVSGRGFNINTAPAKVFQLLHPAISEEAANAIISGPGGRNGPDGAPNTPDDAPFRTVQELSRVPAVAPLLADPTVMGQFTRWCTVQSLIFKVNVKVDLGGMPRTYHALLRRNSNRDIQMLNMDWE
jgi:type II secretory pathway component PulK